MQIDKCLADETASSSPRINPFHLLSHPDSSSPLPALPPHLERLASEGDSSIMANGQPPLHVTKVSQDLVQISSEPASTGSRKVVSKIGNVFRRDNDLDESKQVVMQGPPPSPPLSETDQNEDSDDHDQIPNDVVITPIPALTPLPEVSESTASLYTTGLTTEPAELSTSSPRSHLAVPASRRVSTSSTASRTGSLAVVRASRLAQQRATGLAVETDVKDPTEEGEEKRRPRSRQGSVTSTTRPTPINTSAPRVVRRSTNPTPGAASSLPPRSPLLHTQSTFGQSRTSVPGLDGSALDSDILAHTEIIRRERLERRQKKVEAENEILPKSETHPEPKKEDPKVLVGNLIGEDHVNYVLMYNMLTGIRIGVSLSSREGLRFISDSRFLDVKPK